MSWISVEDQLPEEGGRYIVSDGEQVDIMAYFGTYKKAPDWSSYTGNTLNVTHWQLLPPLPEKKNED